MRKISVIIPSAGIGRRFGSTVPKQFVDVHGNPLLYHTLSAFLKIKFIDEILVVCAPNYEFFVIQNIFECFTVHDRERLSIAAGDDTRHRTIASGINFLQNQESLDIIIIHDGVRPFVSSDLLKQLIEAADKYGAAGPVCNLTSTVVKPNKDGFIEVALDRHKYRNSEMPQVFKYDVIKEAYDNCSEEDYLHGTECLYLVSKYTNHSVKLIDGNPSELFKVTYKKDLYAAEGVLKERKTVKLMSIGERMEGADNIVTEIEAKLREKFPNIDLSSDGQTDTVDLFECDILIYVHFVKHWSELTEDRNLINFIDTKFVYVIVVDKVEQELTRNDVDDNEIHSNVLNCFDDAKNVIFVVNQTAKFVNTKAKLIDMIEFVSWNYAPIINRQIFFV